MGHDGTLYSATINSRFEVTDGKIATEVTNRTNADNGLSSRIQQTVSSISLSVGNNSTTGEIKVSVTKEGGGTASSAASISSITLTANKVTLNGGTNQIGGWVIKDDYLGNMAGTQDSSAASANYFLSQSGKYAYCSMNSGEHNYYLFFKDKFAVDTDGKLYCKNASITGSISSSTISGSTFTLNSVAIKSCSISGYPTGVEGSGDNFSDSGIAIGSTFIGKNGYSGALYKKSGTTYITFFIPQRISSMGNSTTGVITSVTSGISIPTVSGGGGGTTTV